MSDDVLNTRVTRVEGDVEVIKTEIGGIKAQMTGLQSDMRGLASILHRIEEGVASAQQRHENDKLASRMNPIAFGSVLLTIISILVGGAWLISGELARHDERSFHQQRMIDQIERRQWGRVGPGRIAPHGVVSS